MASSTSRPRPRFDSMRSHTSENGNGWARPPSPSFSTTTTGSRINLPANHMLISRKDLRQSIACFEDLMAAAKAYRNALLAMSQATAAFAHAMEACSRVKGCRSANSGLAGASGLQFLMANHEQLLADAVYRQFEIPLLSALDHYKLITADRLGSYEKSLADQSARIRRTEAENLRGGRRKKRDLDAFRLALAELQRQVDELDGIKAGYHEEVLEGEDEIWDTILGKVAFVVRSQLDFYEKIAGKASDAILEPLVSSIPDPFDSYGPPKEEGQIFSVLAPLGLLDSIPQSPTPGFSRTRTPTSLTVGTTSSSPVNSHSGSTSGSSSPSKSAAFPSMTPLPVPARAETTAVSALGISLPEESNGRARRELSVIDEREAGVGGRDDTDGQEAPDADAVEPVRDPLSSFDDVRRPSRVDADGAERREELGEATEPTSGTDDGAARGATDESAPIAGGVQDPESTTRDVVEISAVADAPNRALPAPVAAD